MNYTEEMKLSPAAIEEEGFKRGYRQGFYAAKNSDVTMDEVECWSRGDDWVAPPGSGMAGHKFGELKRYENVETAK